MSIDYSLHSLLRCSQLSDSKLNSLSEGHSTPRHAMSSQVPAPSPQLSFHLLSVYVPVFSSLICCSVCLHTEYDMTLSTLNFKFASRSALQIQRSILCFVYYPCVNVNMINCSIISTANRVWHLSVSDAPLLSWAGNWYYIDVFSMIIKLLFLRKILQKSRKENDNINGFMFYEWV